MGCTGELGRRADYIMESLERGRCMEKDTCRVTWRKAKGHRFSVKQCILYMEGYKLTDEEVR
jgi:hypothetical protein